MENPRRSWVRRRGAPAGGRRAPAAGMIGPALPPHWCRYRDGFVLLQHLHSLAGEDGAEEILGARAAHDLGVSVEYLEEVADYLVEQGYVVYGGGGAGLRLTAEGRDYLIRHAERRRSVRPRPARRTAARFPSASTGLRLGRREWPGLSDLFEGSRRINLLVRRLLLELTAARPPSPLAVRRLRASW